MTRPQHSIRLVALDLDGTTLNPQHEVSPATRAAVNAVTAAGVTVVLASGRLPQSVLPVARTLGLGGVHIGLNGGVSFSMDGELRHRHLLAPADLARVHRELTGRGFEPRIFSAGGLWAPGATDDFEFLRKGGEPPSRTYTPDTLGDIDDACKVVIMAPAGPIDAELSAVFEPDIHVVRSGSEWLEFMPPGVTKGRALLELLEDLAVDPRHVLAIGDSENDASLLAAAGFSVAMGNAVPALKAAADAVTLTNAEDGVAAALYRWVLTS